MWAAFIFIIILIAVVYAGDLGKEYFPETFGHKTETSAKKPVNSQSSVSYAGGKWQLTQQNNQVVASLQGENPQAKVALPVLQVGCWDQKPFAYLQFKAPQANGSVEVQIAFDGGAYQPSGLDVVANYRSYLNPAARYLAWLQHGKTLTIQYPGYGELLFDLPGLATVQFPCLKAQ